MVSTATRRRNRAVGALGASAALALSIGTGLTLAPTAAASPPGNGKDVAATDLSGIKTEMSNPTAYWVTEVIYGGGEPIQPSRYTGNGDIDEFRSTTWLKNAFTGGRISGLSTWGNGLLASDQARTFVDNGGTERNGSTLDYKLRLRLHAGQGHPCTSVPATTGASFAVNATTVTGQNIYVVGDNAALGNWNAGSALLPSSASYPVWKPDVTMAAGTAFEYKYIRKDASGAVTWESGDNRTAPVPATGTVALNDTWRP